MTAKPKSPCFPATYPTVRISLFENGQPVALNFLRFTSPQKLETNADGEAVLPHIRFDRALDYLIGDWMA